MKSFSQEHSSPELVLGYYRFPWQIELLFKRFKQMTQLGHLPRYDQQSAKAWLSGNLLVASLTEKLIQRAFPLRLKPPTPSGSLVHGKSFYSSSASFFKLFILPFSARLLIHDWANIPSRLAELPRTRKIRRVQIQNKLKLIVSLCAG
ncbi:MAG: hypothetical protein JO308_00455 [Verrucomicrobia bacterium]|nr:hypothetical protein [Verrucomicrobiota bacterium]